MTYRIQIRANDRRHWWWVLKAEGNGAILATSEMYTRKASAVRTARKLADSLGTDVEDGPRPRPT